MFDTEARTYTCGQCGEEFEGAWSDEEAEQEMRANFGDLPAEDRVVVCDDCYQLMMFWVRNRGQLAQGGWMAER